MALPFPNFYALFWRSSAPDLSPNPPPNSFSKANANPAFPVSSSDAFVAPDIDAFREKNSPQKICGCTRKRPSKGRQRRQSLDLDFDMVIVQPNHFSGSESEGSDWSVGWFEPHAPEFCSDGEPENSFAVLVPCYGSSSPDNFSREPFKGNRSITSKSQPWAAVLSNISNDSYTENAPSVISCLLKTSEFVLVRLCAPSYTTGMSHRVQKLLNNTEEDGDAVVFISMDLPEGASQDC